MQSIKFLNASDGTANASLMTVQTLRSPGATAIIVNTVSGVHTTGFHASMGAPHTFTDPITSEVITVISDATAVDFAGHINAGQVIIDAIAPGYVDTRGSLVGDIIIIRPTTDWSNNIANVLAAGALNDNGTLAATALDTFYKPTEISPLPFIASGGVWAGLGYGSTLTASMSALVCYINTNRQTVPLITTRTFTANKDTYVDALYNVSGVATIVYTEVANNAASPALAANSVRLGIVVSGATNIAAATSINQGSIYASLPTTTASVPLAVCDSLGNLIYPRPGQKIIGIRVYPAGSGPTATSTSLVAASAGLNIPVLTASLPNGAGNVKATLTSRSASGAAGGWEVGLCLNSVSAANLLPGADVAPAQANMPIVVSGMSSLNANSTIIPAFSSSSGAVAMQSFNSSLIHIVELD